MTRVLHTESGARYEIDTDAGLVRRDREEFTPEKRGDRTWLRLLKPLPEHSLIGSRAVLTLEPLSGYGPDDEGNVGSPNPTTRTTTTVIYDSVED